MNPVFKQAVEVCPFCHDCSTLIVGRFGQLETTLASVFK